MYDYERLFCIYDIVRDSFASLLHMRDSFAYMTMRDYERLFCIYDYERLFCIYDIVRDSFAYMTLAMSYMQQSLSILYAKEPI